MTIAKVAKGDSFQSALSATTWNAFVDAANDYRLRAGKTQKPVRQFDEYSSLTVLVKNMTGGDLGYGAVMALGAPLLTPTAALEEFRYRKGFEGNAPTSSDHGNFVVTAEPIEDGKLGLAFCMGVVAVKVNRTHDFITAADVADGETGYLEAKPNGTAQILWIEDGTGELWATVRLGCRRDCTLTGKTDSTVTANSTGTVSIYDTKTNTGYNVTGVRLDWMHGDQSISLGKEVQITWFDAEQLWRFTGAECEDGSTPSTPGSMQFATLSGDAVETLDGQALEIL